MLLSHGDKNNDYIVCVGYHGDKNNDYKVAVGNYGDRNNLLHRGCWLTMEIRTMIT